MATGSHRLHSASSVLMGTHGAAEVVLGVQGFVPGACLAAAQLTNNASITIPLYLGLGAGTLAQVALKH